MKRLYLLFTIIFAYSFLNAQETYHFRTDAPQGFSIKSSTASGLSLHYALDEITIKGYNNGDALGQEIIMKGSFGSFAEGLPNLPFENRYIAVPRGAKVSIKVRENGCQTLKGIDLLPAAEVMLNNADRLPELHKNMSVFGKDANFPTENVTIAQTTQIRGLDVVMLNVTPFRYNPMKKTLEIIYDMDIDLRFEGGEGQFGDARYRNPAWDNILRNLVINSDILPEAHYYERLNEAIQNREEGCEYLIIAPDDSVFLAWADTLKQFRMRQGILTKIVTTTDCGGNVPENIRNYILNAYENWSIPPAAVLLFGGNHKTSPNLGLKPFIYTSPPSWGHTYTYPTDNPFADMNGDSIPDLAISRMSVYDADDCQRQVEKLISYELDPPTNPHYYDHPVITSGYEENKWFLITSQSVDGFWRKRLAMHPANLYMVYDQMNPEPTPPDSIWSTGFNTNAILEYFGPNGTQYIPATIGELDNWGNMSDPQPLINAMSEGGFLTFYRDHSSNETWGSPYFYTNHIHLIQNEKPTFIFSIGCLTNNFWDNWSADMCLSEAFLRAEPGAIGVIGTNSTTYSHYNDLVTWGMLDYFWPDFMPTLGNQTEPGFNYPSYSLVAGKLFLRQQTFLPYTSDTIKVEKTLNVFSYLGETYLNIYTEVPQPLSVTANAFQRKDQPDYTLTADEGSVVCIAKDDEILYLTQGTGQAQTFSLPTMDAGEQFDLTVTKPKHIRFQQKVTVIPSSGPYMLMENYVFRDGNENDTLEFGETARIDITLFNAGVSVAENTEIQLVCESPYIEILKGIALCPRLEPNGRTTLQNAFRIKVADDIPDQTEIAFSIVLDNGTVVQTIDFQRTATAPILVINPTYTLLTGDEQRTTHILNEGITQIGFKIANTGHCDSGPIIIDFNVLAPFVTVETPHFILENLSPNSLKDLDIPILTQPNDIEGGWLKTKLSISNGNTEAIYELVMQYGGIFENFETDTLNPYFTWENSANYPWEYSEADAAEGRRCFEATPPKNKASRLLISTEGYIPEGKMSFYVKTGRYTSNGLETLTIEEKTTSGNKTQTFSSEDWRYCEANVFPECETLSFQFVMHGTEEFGIRLDDICFPPMHTTIAYSGSDLMICDGTSFELSHAYAYDCDAVLWTTKGDGHFENDTIVNTVYWPGDQDLANGEVMLTLHAISTSDTLNSSTQIRFVDEISLGAIVGDSIVNKYENQISQYSVDNQEGVHYIWQLEPTEAGSIYDHGNAVDILWNLNEGDMEVTLSVIANNGCDMEPATKTINLIGTGTSEWQVFDFELFPNPTDGQVNLVVGETLQGKAIVEVYNLLGERMMTKGFQHLQKGETLCLDLSNFVSGLYIIKLSTENGSCTKKVSVR